MANEDFLNLATTPGEVERAVRFIFDRDAAANPYYIVNKKLGGLARLLEELSVLPSARITQWQGGHRSGLEADCQAEVLFNLTPRAAQALPDWLDSICRQEGCRWQAAG